MYYSIVKGHKHFTADSNITYSNEKTTRPIEIINPSLWMKTKETKANTSRIGPLVKEEHTHANKKTTITTTKTIKQKQISLLQKKMCGDS